MVGRPRPAPVVAQWIRACASPVAGLTGSGRGISVQAVFRSLVSLCFRLSRLSLAMPVGLCATRTRFRLAHRLRACSRGTLSAGAELVWGGRGPEATAACTLDEPG